MKRSRVGGGVLLKVIAAAVLASIAGFGLLGCELELNNEDERAEISGGSDMEIADAVKVLVANTKVTDVTAAKGLTICFHSKGTLSDDQQVIIHGTSNSKPVNLVSGYFGDWASWDEGVNDASATDGAYGSFQKFYTAFKGDDYGVFVFSVPSSSTSTVSCYLNGELACEWTGATSTFASAMIDAITTNGVEVCTSAELTLQGDAYYAPTAVTASQALDLYKWMKNN